MLGENLSTTFPNNEGLWRRTLREAPYGGNINLPHSPRVYINMHPASAASKYINRLNFKLRVYKILAVSGKLFFPSPEPLVLGEKVEIVRENFGLGGVSFFIRSSGEVSRRRWHCVRGRRNTNPRGDNEVDGD